jgi:hypothetical protein
MSDDEADFDDDIAAPEPISVDIDLLESSAARKQAEREELNQQIEAFLASGGRINYVEANLLADPPKKPTSNYGSQPI